MTFLSRRCLLLVLSVVSSSFSAGPLTEYIHAPGKFIAPIPENSLKIERNISLEMCAAKCTLYFRMQQFPCYAFEYTAGSRICAFTNMTTLMVKNGYLGLHVSDGVDYYERSKASFKNLFREIPNSAIRQQNSYYVIKLNSTQEECAYDCLLSHAQTCLSFSYSDRSGTCGLSNVFWTEGNSNGISLLSTKVYNHYQYFTAWPCNVTIPSNYAPRAFASPKFPYLSVTHVECSITLEAPKGNVIRTLVPTFFSSKSVCGNQNEGVTLYDGTSANSAILGKVCDGSSDKLPLINSTTNVMHIRFAAGDTPIAFKAVYEFAAQPQPVDPCTGHHCQNAGKCIASNDRYTCACVPGFSGRFCEANIDDCSGVPCFFNARCIDKINDYKCVCPHGFTGKNCEYFIGACADDPCVHGQCNVTGRNDYTCHCDSGYVGKNCNVSDFCANSPCKHGSCVNTPSGYSCHCEPNYSGTNCDDVIFDVCSLRPCARGKCSSINMQFTCTCESGFTGKLCNTVIDHCNGVNCNHGNCVNDQTGYRCICDANFKGSFCETRKDLCSGINCHYGNCIEEIGGPRCSCNSGYTGAFCNSTIDHCQQSPCIHGTCRNIPNGFLCSCSPGFTGSLCSVNQDFCQNTDCGYGICENTEKGYHCICAKGYYGQRCNETSAGDLCKNHWCQNGGTCHSSIQNYTCECNAGFVGQYCETQTGTKHTACADHPCSIGTCQELPNGIRCVLPELVGHSNTTASMFFRGIYSHLNR